jgi:hypothetical protein
MKMGSIGSVRRRLSQRGRGRELQLLFYFSNVYILSPAFPLASDLGWTWGGLFDFRPFGTSDMQS